MWAQRTQYGFPGPKPFGPWPYILVVEYFGPAGPECCCCTLKQNRAIPRRRVASPHALKPLCFFFPSAPFG